MASEAIREFFAANAGVAGALIGLLFVAFGGRNGVTALTGKVAARPPQPRAAEE